MTWAGTMVACIMMFCAQTVVTMAIRGPLAIQRPRTSKRLTTLGMAPQYSPCSWRRGRQPAMVAFVGQDDDLATAARRPPQNSNPTTMLARPMTASWRQALMTTRRYAFFPYGRVDLETYEAAQSARFAMQRAAQQPKAHEHFWRATSFPTFATQPARKVVARRVGSGDAFGLYRPAEGFGWR